MVSKCANPECDAVFRYFRDGRLFHVERSDGDGKARRNWTEHYWLCGACSERLHLVAGRDGRVEPLPRLPKAA